MNSATDSDVRETISTTERQLRLDQALMLAAECTECIRQAMESDLDVQPKADKSLVTKADIDAEKLFRSRVAELHPDAGIIGEEFGLQGEGADYLWVIDPVDGTEEFAHGVPLYGTIIALYFQNQPLVSVITHPSLGVTLSAAYKMGCLCNGKPLEIEDIAEQALQGRERMAIASRGNFVRFGENGEVFDLLTCKHPNMRIYGCCYMHSCAVLGAMDAAVEWNVRFWDIAATKLLVEEAGGAFVWMKQEEAEGVGMIYSAVFGKPRMVARIIEEIEKG